MIIIMLVAMLATVAATGPGDYVTTGSEKPVRVNEMGPNKM
jgi:hypothetical protein